MTRPGESPHWSKMLGALVAEYHERTTNYDLPGAANVSADISKFVLRNSGALLAALARDERPLHAQPDNVADAALTLGKVIEPFTERLKPKGGWNE